MSNAVAGHIQQLRAAVGRVVVGYEEVLEDLLLAAITRSHVLLEGVPGVAKTTLAKTFAQALGVSFHRVQFTQDLLPADITGHYYFDQKTREFELRKGAIFSQLVLADEINRAPPKTQSALLEAMEERQVTIEGTTLPLPDEFLVVATMNPVDLEGVYRLPEAQLDRFLIRSRLGYLPPDREREMLRRKLERPSETHAVVPGDLLPEARRLAEKVHTDESIITYAQAICLGTREHAAVTLGASPRAMERLLLAARAKAVLEGRDFVIPDDVKSIAPRVLNHRLLLDPEAELAGQTVDRVVAEAIAGARLPDVDIAKR